MYETEETPTMLDEPIERYQTVRARSVELASSLRAEDYIPQPVDFASPPKWHLAHITWFFEEFILKNHLEDYELFDKDFAYLFNSYYNSVGDRAMRSDRGNMSRPSVSEVMDYRKHVDEAMLQLLNQGVGPNVLELLTIGIHHEQQHQELFLTDLKHTFGHNPLFPTYQEHGNRVGHTQQLSGWAEIEEGIYEIGHHGDGFCFDNELGRHKVYLSGCSISKSLVTNGEYLEFIKDGGYDRFELWLDEGWSWVQENEAKYPLYWHIVDHNQKQFTLGGLIDLDEEAILAHINFYEADAFARWKGMRLPTEFEWEAASERFQWGQRWEWTNSAYLPYPGFETAKGALGEYNGKFMINQMVLRGASVVTPKGHERNTYRNFFHPHHRWQFTGIRLAR